MIVDLRWPLLILAHAPEQVPTENFRRFLALFRREVWITAGEHLVAIVGGSGHRSMVPGLHSAEQLPECAAAGNITLLRPNRHRAYPWGMSGTKPQEQKHKKERSRQVATARLGDGTTIDLVAPTDDQTAFVVARDGQHRVETATTIGSSRVVPVPASNSLIRHRVVLLPSAVGSYGSEQELRAEVRDFIHRYVALSPRFERVAAAYVLFSWVYDAFNEVPYLRIRGDYGSGKTRFLQTVGSICRTPIFASGASTVAPLFHALSMFRGTLVLDEADFRFTDEKAELVKILNNGNVRGMPVLRCQASPDGSFDARAYEVFGPKIVATRGLYDDKALESRFLTEQTGGEPLREDIPINLPDAHAAEAEALRNKLLAYRIRTLSGVQMDLPELFPELEPRLRQIISPLCAVCPDDETRWAIFEVAQALGEDLQTDRGMTIEADLLAIIHELDEATSKRSLPLKTITAAFKERFGPEYDNRITARTLGQVLRKKLNLRPRKSHGNYALPLTDRTRLEQLYEKFGLREKEPEERIVADERGDQRDIERDPIGW